MPPTAQEKITLDGSLALETNVSNHSGDSRSFRVFRDLVTDVGKRILKRDGRGATLGSVAGTEIQAIHEYVYVDPATGAETYHILGAIDGGFYIYRWNGSTTWSAQTLPITPTAAGRWGFMNADNRVFAFNGKDALLVGIQTGATTITWRIAGVDAPTFAPTYSLTSANAPYSVGVLPTVTQGATTITGAVPAIWPVAAAPSGFTGAVIVINGNAYDIVLVTTAGNGTTIAPVLTISEGFKEVTAINLPYTIYWGVGDWDDIAAQYRFSYYNPTTGHVSNPSPILQVTETFQVNRTITITIPGSAENTTAYNNGYTQIQLFRTPKNAGIPVALNEKLNNNGAGSAITYVETVTKFADTYLTDFIAPNLNRKPPSGIASMVFQQGRGWAVHAPTGTTRFTPISVEVDFGKAIECWPALYKRDIPSAPRGLVVVGGESSADSLVIQTSRGDFSMDGFDSTTFSPYKLPTRRSGSYLGAATDVDGRLCSFYADNRILVMRDDIGRKIQNVLKLVKPSLISNVRLHWYAANERNYLLLSVPKNFSSTANDYTYVFDLDLDGGPIYEWNFGISAFATVHDASTLAIQLFAGDPSGAVYKLLVGATQDAGGNFTPTLKTGLMRFPKVAAEGDIRAIIKYVKLWVNDAQVTAAPATAWAGTMYLNEQTNGSATDGTVTALAFRQADYRYQSAQGLELIWTPTGSVRHKAKVCQFDFTMPTANAALWIEQIEIGYDVGTSTGA